MRGNKVGSCLVCRIIFKQLIKHYEVIPNTARTGLAQWHSSGDWGFGSWQGLGIFLLTTASTLGLGLTQSPCQWVPGVLSLGVKWLGCKADHLPLSSAEVKNA